MPQVRQPHDTISHRVWKHWDPPPVWTTAAIPNERNRGNKELILTVQGEGKISLSQGCQALLLGEVSVLSSECFPSVTGASELLQQPHLAMCDPVPSDWKRKPQGLSKT